MQIVIDTNNNGKTIRNFLRGELGFSSAMLKKLKFSENGILVNGEFRTVRYELQTGDVLSLATEDSEADVSPYIIPVDIPIEIVYSDENIYAVNKPPYMPAHPSFGHRDDTVANALAFLNSDEPYVFRPVNRLDRDTSGVMLVARNRLSAYTLYKSMVNNEIKKHYLAVLSEVPEQKHGTIENYLKRCPDSIVKREICDESEGKYARTDYEVIYEANGCALVLACPVTGRTHQLRVQFAGIGAPICGDTMYGDVSEFINRQALHAFCIDFPSPADGAGLHISASIPDDICSLVKNIFGLSKEETEAMLNERTTEKDNQ